MIHVFGDGTDVVAVEDDLATKLVPVLTDVVVLHHDDHHVHLGDELVEVEDLVFHDCLIREEGVEGLERACEVAFLDVEHLKSRTFADVVDVLFVS